MNNRLRVLRAERNWSQQDLAARAKVSLSTVRDFEKRRRKPIANNLAAIRRALEAAGVEFTNGDAPGVRLKKAQGRARR